MITQFALRLIFGMSAVWCVMPRRHVTSGFFRIQMLVTLGMSVLAAMAAKQIPMRGDLKLISPDTVMWISCGLAGVSFLGSVLWTLERRTAGSVVAFMIAGTAGATVVLANTSSAEILSRDGSIYWLSEIATALVSGAAVAGMLLGHWYLTAPTMSTAPLNQVNNWLGAVAAVRFVLGIVALVLLGEQLADMMNGVGGRMWTTTHTVWLSVQWIGGMVGPLAVWIAVVKILKFKNTQAATGVLFVGVILAFMGEMTGELLRQELALPL